MNADRIAELRALAEKATPGPWLNGTWRGHCNLPDHAVGHHGETSPCVYDFEMLERPGYIVTSEPNTYIVSSDDYGQVLSDGNAAFIAAARTALPEALDEVDRLGGIIDKIEDLALTADWFDFPKDRLLDLIAESAPRDA